MAIVKFSTGQRVQVAFTRVPVTPGGIYQVVCALPETSGPLRYRVKADGEAFERIVDASRLKELEHE